LEGFQEADFYSNAFYTLPNFFSHDPRFSPTVLAFGILYTDAEAGVG
jgi:hypothetical protein